MDDFCVVDFKKIEEIIGLLKSIDKKLSHLIEQNRVEKCMYRRSEEGF